MNAGFSNLADLKVQLLNEGLRADTTYDAQILVIGLGMAAKIAAHSNRQFARQVDDFYVVTGGRQSVVLPRYPVESVTRVEVRDDHSDPWVEEVDAVETLLPGSGVLRFGATFGDQQIRVTYTGGYHWETKEPTDAGFPTALPSGAAPLPDAVRAAWILQCQHVWRRIDKLGLSLGEAETNKVNTGMADLGLVPLVVDLLRAHQRYALT